MTENDIGTQVIKAAYLVHQQLGPVLLESSYERCLFYELAINGLKVESQVLVPLIYKGLKLDHGYRLDLFIQDKVIVEVKAVDAINDVHLAQILTYLKLTKCRVGYILNFNVRYFKSGIKRVIL
jgi:GxxExxY protein